MKIFTKFKKKINLNLIYFTKNSIWVGLNQLIVFVAGIGMSVIFARFTTKEVYGNYNYIISIIALLSIISMPGLNTSLIRAVSRNNDGVYFKVFKTSFLWSLTGIPLLLIIGSYYYYQNSILGIAFLGSSILFPFYYSLNKWIPFLQGKNKFDSFAKKNSILVILSSLSVAGIIVLSQGKLLYILFTFLIINILIHLFFFLSSRKYLNNKKVEDNWKSSGYKLTIINFISFCYDYVDKIIIGIFLGPVELAIYSISAGIVIKIRTIIKELLKVAYPKVFNIKDQNQLLTKTFKIVPFLFILISVGSILLIILIPSLITLLYGSEYEAAIFYAQIYLITIPFSFITYVTTIILIAINKEKILIKFNIFTIVINFFLYLILIPFYGIIGAIISSILYFISKNIIHIIFLLRVKRNK